MGDRNVDLPEGTILFETVSKSFPILTKRSPRAGAWLFSKALEYFAREPFQALSEVSLRIEPGKMVAFVGRNGAGKSTILKLISGITKPDSGRVTCSGNVASLLELGVGFHPELNGVENIFYSGVMLGLSRQQILQRLDTIVEFSGIEPFLFQPVKHYSSGMYSRLGLSIALHMDASIILMDEVLGVGDIEFQHRTYERVLALNRSGVTIVIVTHEPRVLRDLCHEGYWIDEGRIRACGEPVALYEAFSAAMTETSMRTSALAKSLAVADATLLSFEAPESGTTGKPLRLSFNVRVEQGPVCLGIRFRRPDGIVLFEDLSQPVLPDEGRLEIEYIIESLPFARCVALIDFVVLSHDKSTSFLAIDGLHRMTIFSPEFDIDHYVLAPVALWSIEKISPQSGTNGFFPE